LLATDLAPLVIIFIFTLYLPPVVQQDEDDSYDNDLTKNDPLNEVCFSLRKSLLIFELGEAKVK